jgi:hypothetical protein
VKRHAPVLLLFAVLAVAMTWPLASHLGSAVANMGDPLINTWILDWDWYATFHSPLWLFQANAFYPAKYALAFSENLYGIALFLFPLRALGMSPVAAMNVAMLAGFALCGFAAYLLGWHLTSSRAAGIAAGVFYAFVPYRFGHLSQVQYVWGWPLPLLLLGLLHYKRQPTPRAAALFGVAFVLNGLANMHALLFGSVAIALAALILRPRWIPLLISTAISMLILLPFLVPYWRASKLYGMERSAAETMHYSAQPKDWLEAPPENRLYGGESKVDPERRLFPGVIALLCTAGLWPAVAAAFGRRTRAGGSRYSRLEAGAPSAVALSWVLLGFLGSLGLHTFFHRFLFAWVPGFRAIRVPARWAIITYVGLAMFVALATAMLPRLRWLVALLLLFELCAAPVRWQLLPSEIPPVYMWLKDAKLQAIVEMPIRERLNDYLYLLRATVHHRPIANGISGFDPPERQRLAGLSLDEMQRLGIDTIVVHADTADDATWEWLRRERPRFLRRFDSPAGNGDWVFSVARGDAPPPLPPGFNGATFGLLQFPQTGETLKKAAFFSGFALSPYGIRRVDLLFDNGAHRIRAELIADPGLSKRYPYYDATTRPRFVKGFDRRPPEIREVTDVQVEIEDGNGHVTRLLSHLFRWP